MRLLLVAITIGWGASALAQYCPSYTPDIESKCAHFPVAGINPTVLEWQAIFDTVARGPSEWGDQGPAVADIPSGCDSPLAKTMVPARYPCELLKAIARQESLWQHFCVPTTPASQKGMPSRTIVSFDCGYGIGQVTSGMRVGDATPSFDPTRVTSEPTYNLAAGTLILAQKWRGTACVGDRDPTRIEDWYTSTWAYNGLAYKNNPTNPIYSATRGVWDPKGGGSAPYQEKVWGWIEHPPTPQHWTSTALAYPKLSEMGSTGKPGALSEPACATPTSCAAQRDTHVSSCFGAVASDLAAPEDLASLPDLAQQAAPLDLSEVTPIDGGNVRGGCACRITEIGGSDIGGAGVLLLFVMTMRRARSLQG